jgi:hypothetical protein
VVVVHLKEEEEEEEGVLKPQVLEGNVFALVVEKLPHIKRAFLAISKSVQTAVPKW